MSWTPDCVNSLIVSWWGHGIFSLGKYSPHASIAIDWYPILNCGKNFPNYLNDTKTASSSLTQQILAWLKIWITVSFLRFVALLSLFISTGSDSQGQAHFQACNYFSSWHHDGAFEQPHWTPSFLVPRVSFETIWRHPVFDVMQFRRSRTSKYEQFLIE